MVFSLTPRASNALTVPNTSQKPIIEEALTFVLLLDSQRPLKAWARSTVYFRKKLSPQRWQRLFTAQRQRFGRPVARSLDGYSFLSVFEQATDGLYLEVRFRTDFEARADIIERVVMYKDFDGRWRVIGYFLKRD